MSHHTEQAVKTATNRAEPRQHKAVDDAVRDHAGRSVRPWCGCRVEKFPLNRIYTLTLGNAATITAASRPPRLCGLQIGSPVGCMHPRLRDQVVRYGLAVEIVPLAWPSKLLRKAACALAAAETMLVGSVNVCAANLAKHSGRRRIGWQRQTLRRQPRGKAVVGSVAHCLGSINLKSTAQFEILHYQQFLSLIPSSGKQRAQYPPRASLETPWNASSGLSTSLEL